MAAVLHQMSIVLLATAGNWYALPPLWSGRRGLRLGGRYEATMVIEGKEGERAGYEMWMPAWWEPLSEAPLDKQYEVLDKIQDDLRNFGPGDADVVTLVKGLL